VRRRRKVAIAVGKFARAKLAALTFPEASFPAGRN
jgi:hypothetical protein